MTNKGGGYTASEESGRNDDEVDVWCYAEEKSDI